MSAFIYQIGEKILYISVSELFLKTEGSFNFEKNMKTEKMEMSSHFYHHLINSVLQLS